MKSIADIFDYQVINKETGEVLITGELTPVSAMTGESEYKPIRRVIVSEKVLKECKIGEHIKIKVVIKGNDFSIEGDIVEINGFEIGVQ
jgi:hypothetical protein